MSDVKDFYTHYCHLAFFRHYHSMLSVCSCFFLSCQSNNLMLCPFTFWVLLCIYYLLPLPDLFPSGLLHCLPQPPLLSPKICHFPSLLISLSGIFFLIFPTTQSHISTTHIQKSLLINENILLLINPVFG